MHVDECVSAHGIMHEDDRVLPTPYISFLRSFPKTGVLSKTNPIYKGSSMIYEYAYCFPTKLTDYLPYKDDKAHKMPTSSQSAHIDGMLKLATSSPPWCSLLTTISPNAFVRVWEYSHDLIERLFHVETNVPSVSNRDPAIRDEMVWQHVRNTAPLGSTVQQGAMMSYRIFNLCRGQSMIFLPSLVHAGCCVRPNETYINYRIHAYLVRPNCFLESNTAVIPHVGIQASCENYAGGDYNV